jgi:hypothetical protein
VLFDKAKEAVLALDIILELEGEARKGDSLVPPVSITWLTNSGKSPKVLTK